VSDEGTAAPRNPAVPWDGKPERLDVILLAAITLSGFYALAMLPLTPTLVGSHPVLLELLRGSMTGMVTMGAMSRIGDASIVVAVLAAIPGLMMFDWVFWWAGKRWGDRVFVWLTGGPGPRTDRRLARLHRLESRFGPFALVLAYFLPVPSVLIYAAVGDGGMRLRVFLALDLLGTLLWTSLLAGLGYGLGHSAVDVANTIAHYGLWATLALVVVAALWGARGRRA
jgi:membrane-associated protein